MHKNPVSTSYVRCVKKYLQFFLLLEQVSPLCFQWLTGLFLNVCSWMLGHGTLVQLKSLYNIYVEHPAVTYEQEWRIGAVNHKNVCSILLYIILQHFSTFFFKKKHHHVISNT